MINGCNNQSRKLISENNHTVEIKEKTKKPFDNENNLNKKILGNIIKENNNITPKEKNNNIIFEFRNERLLQGRDIPNINIEKKTGLMIA